MSKLLQLRGGTTAEHTSFTGAVREVTVDTDKDTLVVHDGTTAGGHVLPRTKADIDALNIDADTLDGKQLATIESEYQAFANTAANTAAANVVDSAPGTLDTLNELAAALGDDANFSTTVTNSIATKMPLAGGTFTGDITRGGTVISDGAISDTGTFTLDVVGNIVLDADNSGSIHLKDNNVQYGTLYKSGNNFVQYNPVSDGDIVFQGLDGASTINALTLDMSAAGRANFNSGANFQDHVYFVDNAVASFGASNDLQIYHNGSQSIIQDNGTGDLRIQAANLQLNSWDNAESYITCQDNGAVNLFYDNAVKLATSASGITITGDATATNFNTTSDATLKTNVETLTGSLDAVKAMRGVSFDWIENGGSEVGVIAQEVEAVLPDLVSTNDEGIKSVKYGNIVAVLIEAIKEQQVQIDELKEQLNS